MGNETVTKTEEDHIEKLLSEITNLHDRIACVNSTQSWLREENARLSAELAKASRNRVALACIKRSVDKLADAVRRGVYDSRSTVGDEVLNMLQEFEDLDDARDGRGRG